MTNLAVVSNDSTIISIDAKVERMKQLQIEIKILTTEFDLLKKEMIAGYFSNHTQYVTSSKLIVVTYKPQDREVFNQTRFKLDHEQMFFAYRETQQVYTFAVK